ncbi:MAG: 2-nitropropane dioxygenase [Spirochaetes bacterium GWD1_61_31]|nr:MAG: 2-nitropropane dioxygenase [Spirochaetes bacterium GWB1_60_80]OHD32739.1 MAG: 2-nitropropane dioxygenase [Spirochaetes bacterium GWC1_61_12]OHD40605.1 MAG: 2-nitropropane dioxygenase [Spirochaetes bacterium GWD1_61_31]OHD43877.1 MAG: 2-nitropropane dioxygenase [Spirochaetes bacterium GWE1_60_18]OHD59748.1 MAG: 2-nitropropane dioxygenase [Spirochaetes bacterium GWF1_60_12]HAP43531.1 nitronate monooxygenase [Spirochaetaceae bacterium]
MSLSGWTKLRIGGLISRIPIVQGGMGVGISLSGLAAATANSGGVGVIAAAGIGLLEPDGLADFVGASVRALRREIRRARELTKGILGVNVMVALTNFADMVRTAIEEGIDVIFCGAGLPVNLPEFLKEGIRTRLVPIVSSARAAALIAKRWLSRYSYRPDAVVVEGPKAGGHLGFAPEQLDDPAYRLEKLVPEVVAALLPFADGDTPIPVIAAGGVYSGADIHRLQQLGAAGVQMATRFVATDECDASAAFKETYINAVESDLTIIASPVGMPGRALNNGFLDAVAAGRKVPNACPYHCIASCDAATAPYCISRALLNAQRGKLDQGFAFAGANVARVEGIVPVQQLVDSLAAEYRAEENG